MEGHSKCDENSKKETIICAQARQLYRLLELLPGDDPTTPPRSIPISDIYVETSCEPTS